MKSRTNRYTSVSGFPLFSQSESFDTLNRTERSTKLFHHDYSNYSVDLR